MICQLREYADTRPNFDLDLGGNYAERAFNPDQLDVEMPQTYGLEESDPTDPVERNKYDR